MKKLIILLSIILIGFYSDGFAQIQLQSAFPNLVFTNPIDLEYANDGTDRLFVVEQNGIIKVFQNSSSASSVKVFLDISSQVSTESDEMGLLGLAFHPDYINNGYFYVNYTTYAPARMTRISRFKISSTNPDSADKNSELVLIAQDQPFNNHKGGRTTFGPDGYLYLGLGDGGSGGDPNNNAQNCSVLLGKILRIDVNSTQGSLNYGIPPTNPFKGNTQGWREEIYAYGLRNPWRFSFDPATGWLWCGDVGQSAWEEIDIIQNGQNYGWRCYEGLYPYNTTGCNGTDYISPIIDYDHTGGRCAIIGGFVYRGKNAPGLTGNYIYADYCSKSIWALQYDSTAPPINTLLLTSPFGMPLAFAIDKNQELYTLASDGKIYNFKPTALPVELTNFSAKQDNGIVLLKWETATEIENVGFDIERKTAMDKQFTKVGFIKGSGNSSTPKMYSFSDTKNQGGKSSYRLHQISTNGAAIYSNEIEVIVIPSEYILYQNYPNPFNPSTVIKYAIPFDSKVTLEVYNITGQRIGELVNEEQTAGYYTIDFNSSSFNKNISSGVYFYRIIATNKADGTSFTTIKKMVMLK
jgi:glucose/arabinose dehydrogenase